MQKGPLLGQGRTAEVYAWGDFQVLKLFFTTWPVDCIHQEARVARLVHEAGLASPATGDLIEVEGRLGIVFERVDGPSMLEDVARHPWRIVSAAHQFADLQLWKSQTPKEFIDWSVELYQQYLPWFEGWFPIDNGNVRVH